MPMHVNEVLAKAVDSFLRVPEPGVGLRGMSFLDNTSLQFFEVMVFNYGEKSRGTLCLGLLKVRARKLIQMELRRYRTLNAKHITSVLEQKGCVSDYQVSKDYLPSKHLLGCNHLWLRISREAWLGPCNSRSHEFSVKLSPRANITWRALTWLLAGVSCSWLWASDLCSLANDLFRICWKSSHQYGSQLSPEQGIREKEEEHKTEAIFFSAQPQRWRISTATFCWWHKLQSKWQKATTGFSHQEAEVTRDHPGGCLPQLLTPHQGHVVVKVIHSPHVSKFTGLFSDSSL